MTDRTLVMELRMDGELCESADGENLKCLEATGRSFIDLCLSESHQNRTAVGRSGATCRPTRHRLIFTT